MFKLFGKKVKEEKVFVWKIIGMKYDKKILSRMEEFECKTIEDAIDVAKEKGLMTMTVTYGNYCGFWIRLFDGNFYSIPKIFTGLILTP